MEHLAVEGGEQYLPFARARVKALQALGLGYASQNLDTGDAEIHVRIEPGHEYIRITGAPYDILSGAARYGEVVELPVPPGSPEGTKPAKTLREFRPTAQAWEYPLKKSTANPAEAYNNIKRLAITSAPGQYATLAPSMYSGTMAKVAQLILGYGKVKGTPYSQTGVELKYRYGWEKTHGCVKGPLDEKGEFIWWLLEISSENGVIAMPLPLFANTKGMSTSKQDVLKEGAKLLNGLPSGALFPAGAKLTAAIASGKVKRLATVEAMAPYFSKSPYHQDLGWSFNNAGSEAHNTCYKVDSPNSVTGYHYKLTILIGDNPSATLEEVSHGPITHNPSNNSFLQMNFAGAGILGGTVGDTDAGYIEDTPAGTTTTLFVCHRGDVLDRVYANYDPNFRNILEYSDIHAAGIVPFAPGWVIRGTAVDGRRLRSSLAPDMVTMPWADVTRWDSVFLQKNSGSQVDPVTGSTLYGETILIAYHRVRKLFQRNVVNWAQGTRDAYAFVEEQDGNQIVDMHQVQHNTWVNDDYQNAYEGPLEITNPGNNEAFWRAHGYAGVHWPPDSDWQFFSMATWDGTVTSSFALQLFVTVGTGVKYDLYKPDGQVEVLPEDNFNPESDPDSNRFIDALEAVVTMSMFGDQQVAIASVDTTKYIGSLVNAGEGHVDEGGIFYTFLGYT